MISSRRRRLPLYEISNFARASPSLAAQPQVLDRRAVRRIRARRARLRARGERRSNRRDLDGYLADLAAGRSPRRLARAVRSRSPARRRRSSWGCGVAEGVDLGALGARYDADLMTRHAAAWERGAAAGLIAWDGSRVRLTPAGRVRSNELFAELIGDPA